MGQPVTVRGNYFGESPPAMRRQQDRHSGAQKTGKKKKADPVIPAAGKVVKRCDAHGQGFPLSSNPQNAPS